MAIITKPINYKDNDSVSAEVMNNIIDTCINANEKAVDANEKATKLVQTPDASSANLVGIANVYIDPINGNLVFQNLKGERGIDGVGIEDINVVNTKVQNGYTINEIEVLKTDDTEPITFYLSVKNGEQGTQGIQGPQGTQGIQGPQGETGKNANVRYHSEYSNTETYYNNGEFLDIVQYNGSSYAPTVSSTMGSAPSPNNSKWGIIASKSTGAIIDFDEDTGIVTITT